MNRQDACRARIRKQSFTTKDAKDAENFCGFRLASWRPVWSGPPV